MSINFNHKLWLATILFLIVLILSSVKNNTTNSLFAVDRSSTKIATSYKRGMSYLNQQDYERAIANFQQALAIQPQPHLYNALGMAYANLKEESKALTAFEQAIAIDKNFASAYYNRGKLYQERGQLELALTEYDRTLELTNEQHIAASIARASIYLGQHQYYLAQQDLERAIAIAPDNTNAYYNRALLHASLGNMPAYFADLATVKQLEER